MPGINSHQFSRLIKYIQENHNPTMPIKGNVSIKYIDASFDFRSNTVFKINLRGYGWEKKFAVVNENRHKNLYDWVMNFIENDLTSRY